ncbi:butyrophilin subfamily 1 member A1-like [Astyanax mexicanus]|uniref:butyrophilin subfamily 1 member A1-like n=1 Tax=Astyanax mexicanus TaxID=7994 RepID=UPI0020CAECB2|nr:butyrophilin subfamily 1 member A1-like [Astyanax mexicanus]
MKFMYTALLLLYNFTPSRSEDIKVVGPSFPLTAAVGEDLILPCSLQPNISAVDMTVEWLRLDQKDSIVHLYMEHEDRSKEQAVSYRGRTQLFKEELQKGNTSLKLSTVHVSDTGKYKCVVRSKSSYRSWYDDITLDVLIQGTGTDPVITVEQLGVSGGISLMCESKGWNPEPEILWLNSEGAALNAEATETERHSEGITVKRRVTVYKTNSNRFYCRVKQEHHMKQTEIIISGESFIGWWISLILNFLLSSLMLIGIIVILIHNKRKGQPCYKEDGNPQVTVRLSPELSESDLSDGSESVSSDKDSDHATDLLEPDIAPANPAWREQFVTCRTQAQQLKRQLVFKVDFPDYLPFTDIEQMKQILCYNYLLFFPVDVFMDINTAHPYLNLSENRKQVKYGKKRENFSDQQQAFDDCVFILGTEGFQRSFYFEVQVRGKTDWTVGVARETIKKNGDITLNPGFGFWTLSKGNYMYVPSVSVSKSHNPQNVGVFVDYKDGMVYFYDVDANVLIACFNDDAFSEKLYPIFSPGTKWGGKNSAPLIINEPTQFCDTEHSENQETELVLCSD